MDFVQIAIVNQTNRISSSELSEAVAAIQKQVNRDFAPIWNINGTLASFNDVKSVPLG
jgi:NADH/NAD ratio-sensing transcriptional regulator Rex